MNSKIIKIFLSLLLGVVLFAGSTFGEEGDGKKKSNTFNKPMADPIRAYLNINFVSTIIKNDGISDINIGQDASGLIYPKGSGRTAVYTSGLLWGAQVNDPLEQDPHIGGTAYRTGLQPGWIDPNGVVVTDDPKVRIFRVRPVTYPGLTTSDVDVSVEAIDEIKSEQEVLDQYQLDWTEWPAELGAPYYDGNGNGMYDPVPNPDPELMDIPGVPGADQSIWYVTNDQASSRTNDMYGTEPMGIEMQATFWAYAQTGALGNMFFRRYTIINKTDVMGTNRTFDSMYVSMFSDPDVGDAGDDFAGCDTVLSITMAYNGQANDAIYGGTPPAVGFDFFQGPIVDSPGDSAIFQGEWIQDKRNLPMTAAYYYINDDPTLTDPVQGSYSEGAVRFYRFMKGRIGLNNNPFVDPNTGLPSTFTLPGDPTSGTPGWVDGQQFAPGDRRIGAASGPFTMEPGDIQEIVVAEILGGAVTGVDRLSAISLMKFYDQVAQVAYDNFFDLPTPPPAPDVTVAELDGEIVLDWSKDNSKVLATETSNIKGYEFQGYNVYQLPTSSSAVSEGVRVATFDVIDGVGKINDLVFDPTTGSVVVLPTQFGNDTGIKRFISIKDDAINQRPLINGIRYYFGVTSYNYNPDPLSVPNNLENPVKILTLIPNSNNPGVTLGEGNGDELSITHEGTADGGPMVTIVDPTATTGHDYQVFFNDQAQIRNENGDWVAAATVMRQFNPNDPDTLVGTTVDIAGVYAGDGTNIDLQFHLDVIHHYYGWADGVTLKFPAGTNIVDVPAFTTAGGDETPEIVIVDNMGANPTVLLGVTDDSQTQAGIFHDGGEDWNVIVDPNSYTLPLSVDWIVHDDGYAGGENETGITLVEEIGYAARVAEHWNVQDVTTGEVILPEQTVINGTDLYPPRDDSPTELGLDAAPVIDGFQINMSIVWGAPVDFTTLTVDGEGTYDIDSYYANGWAATAKAIDTWGAGTTELAELQKDYELRFTGVYEETQVEHVIGSDTLFVWKIQEGTGSIATLEGSRLYDIADHPMNPTPGSSDPFTIGIPFEVWSIDDEKQINILVYDRGQDLDPGFGSKDWYPFNPAGRMYCHFLPTDYHENVVDVNGAEVDNLTWNTVWWETGWENGDVLTFQYDNPIVKGTDTYGFNTTAEAYSSDLARNQVDEINVFPNPYYGINSEEINKYNRFVTFNHIPDGNVKVRIFNLAGVLVRTIDKTDEGQFMRWDLANEDGLPVASGLYIAYIDLPDLGTTKILKLAIVQEQQILDRF